MTAQQGPWERVIRAQLLSGTEPIRGTGATLIDYWRWAHSDLVSNAARGILAEFLVANAVGDPSPVRDPWGVHDVTMPPGDGHPEIRIEVKSGGYLQAWWQSSYSRIQFGRLQSRAWNHETGGFAVCPDYHADVYVFAVHACRDPDAIDPLDASQWDFRVLPRKAISALRLKSISWSRIQRLSPTRLTIDQLAQAARKAHRLNDI